MISIIMPFWMRQEATDKALKLFEQYKGLDFEVIIVDDGSPVPYVLSYYTFPVRVVRLPYKTEPKCPCVPFNRGVEAANGDVLVITNPETLHEKPVLGEMYEELKRLGSDGYVLAAAWCPEQNAWHCHSSLKNENVPEGAGLHFCGMLHRSLWDKCWGFDEAYRDGMAFDDNDFVYRLEKAGAKFCIRDDLVVIHPKTGATTNWPAGGWERNRDLFLLKWKQAVTICCVQAGNYQGRGAEYVNNLYDMVVRNMPAGVPFRFVCFTDDKTGLTEGIEARDLPEPNLEGWWNKLALFKRGVFADGERVVYFDLDTLIVGPLDDIVRYSGSFALLRDFYRPDGYGSGVMAWEAGDPWDKDIWEAWNDADRPAIVGGDQAWLEKVVHIPNILQDLYSDKFVSYKVHCKPYPPQGSSVVCFHGEPRPHNCTQKWVQDVWKIGGATSLTVQTEPNTNNDVVMKNIRINSSKGKWVKQAPAHGETALICGSGPSLLDTLPQIRAYKGFRFALNNTAKILHDNGIQADYHVLLDARQENVEFVKEPYAKAYLLASQCHPDLFECVKDREFYIWHAITEGIQDVLGGDVSLIGGGTTVGLSCMALAYTMGFRKFGLFGYDSSYRDNKGHAAPQRRTPVESMTFDVTVNDRTFKSNAAMAKQAELFPQFAMQLAELDCEIYVFGDGLLPHIARTLTT